MQYKIHATVEFSSQKSVCQKWIHCAYINPDVTKAPKPSHPLAHQLRCQIKISHLANHGLHGLW